MSKKMGGLGDGEYGEVSLFGLDEFGAPVGMSPAWGGVIGAGVQTVAAVGIRKFTNSATWWKWSEALGAAAAAVVAAPLIFMEGTRAAGWTGLAAGLISGGIRQLEVSMADPAKAMAAMSAMVSQMHGNIGVATIGPAMIPGLNGNVMVQPLGATVMYPAEIPGQMNGATVIGPAMIPGQMNGAQFGGAPAQLLGAQAQLLGVPISGASALASHFGTTAIG